MSKFNKNKGVPTTRTYEGGAAYEKNPIDEWLNFLLSSFCEPGFYEDAETQVKRFLELTDDIIEKYGAAFVSRAAIFARDVMGMRSISQLVAARLNREQFQNKRLFYSCFFTRPDDVAEVFSIIDAFGDKRSHALIRGAADYLRNLNGYKLDKYSMRRKDWSMLDIINVTHAYSKPIDDFYNGRASKANTWEQLISAAKDKEERDGIWRMLVETDQLGYMALIRNLNNIMDAGIDERFLFRHLVPQITNKVAILRSRIFPYQIYTAYKNLKVKNTHVVRALEEAFRKSVSNMPALPGSTCVILDVSGSMLDGISERSNVTIKEAGAVYAAAILFANRDADMYKFATYYKRYKFNVLNNLFDSIQEMCDEEGLGGGTNIVPVFKALDRHYDRIFLISDMQVMDEKSCGWLTLCTDDNCTAYEAMNKYCALFGKSVVYSFDLGHYHTQISNPRSDNLVMMTGLSHKVFELLKFFEDGVDIVRYINSNCAYDF